MVFDRGGTSQAKPMLICSNGYTTINSASQLDAVRNNLFGCYRLTNSFAYAGTSLDDANSPLSGTLSGFVGIFDGNGQTLSNISLTSGSHGTYGGGLFHINYGEIRNLKINGFTALANYQVGPVVGYFNSAGFAPDFEVGTPVVTCAGAAWGKGLVERVSVAGTISQVYTTNAGQSGTVAGLVLINDGIVRQSKFIGSISGARVYSAGIVGRNNGTVEDVLMQGTINESGTFASGIVYFNEGLIKNSISLPTYSGSFAFKGGISANGAGSAVGSYWDTQLSGTTTSGHGAGRRTCELKGTSPCANRLPVFEGWASPSSVWSYGVVGSYPNLLTAP